MKTKFLLLTIAFSGILYSCHSSKKAGKEAVALSGSDSIAYKDSLARAAHISDTIIGKIFRRPIRDKELFTAVKDLVTMDTAYIHQDTLHLWTKKLAACEAEKFNLVWNGAMLKSMPPQTTVKLLQTADANCKGSNYLHLTYNITPLRFKEDTLQSGTRTTIVRVNGWKNPLRYEFTAKGFAADSAKRK